ncbi:methylmalonyl-CoA carboxyltransferase [Boudabousia tangfeifanii]|uniref:Methylmalonyl-CoA carboxyltransferase n=1 Tax=Boudabousia tangfeifanii TaxID=1912795 RepID=A0A1D9MKS0_9ACTO|nr:acyl-CoA carboxylase subunit beta [Boudabousia tangfeifanii]AOZ72885.1 methylmalonyl-CoA carboxyltransferase [Boudabousia tangfeifanii]
MLSSLFRRQRTPRERPARDRRTCAAHLTELAEKAENRAKKTQHDKGKMTARERLEMLADPGTFREINRFLGGDIDEEYLGSGVITGFCQIGGRPVAVYAQDFSVRGGSLGQVEGQKMIHLIKQAVDLGMPIISLLDSGGARIQEGVAALAQYGKVFQATSLASGVVPQISVILGPCAGGAVYGPALTDFVVMTKRSSFMFVTGPEVVKAVTGEVVTSDELGGAQMHSAVTGVSHYLAEDEADALDFTRTLLSYLPANSKEAPPTFAYQTNQADLENAARVGELVPVSPKQSYDMVEVITSLVDHGEFLEIQELFAPSVITGFGAFCGQSVGIVANQSLVDAGTLDVNASEKAARFVQFCNAFSFPVVTLVDVPGYRPGTEQERAGIIRRGAKVITAYATATVPLITVIVRKAYGGAYIVMGSKAMGADFNFAWPGAQIAVMGSEGAVNIVYRKELAQAKADGKDLAEARKRLEETYATQAVSPNLSLEIGELDGLITPEQTRDTICQALAATRNKQRRPNAWAHAANPPL